jgi:hypothetical protein
MTGVDIEEVERHILAEQNVAGLHALWLGHCRHIFELLHKERNELLHK